MGGSSVLQKTDDFDFSSCIYFHMTRNQNFHFQTNINPPCKAMREILPGAVFFADEGLTSTVKEIL